MPRIGASNFAVSELLTDDANGFTYDAPYAFTKKLMSIGYQNNANKVNLEADDQVVETIIGYGDIALALQVADCTPREKAMLFGNDFISGVRIRKPDDVSPYFSAMWKTLKSNKKYRFFKVLKTIFIDNDETAETKKQTPAFQTPTINGSGVQRLYDGQNFYEMDEDDPDVDATILANWFAAGDLTFDLVAPTVSVVPADAAVGIAVSANIVWTFNKAIQPSTMTDANFFVMKADGTPVAGTLTIGTNNTVVTFDPTSNMSAATAHIAIATMGVKSSAGVSLAAVSATNFTTA